MLTAKQLIVEIQKIESLDDKSKQAWIGRINQEGLTDSLIDEIMDLLDHKIEDVYEKIGIYTVDKNDPKDQASYDKMIKGLTKAKSDFDKTMQGVNNQIKKITEDSIKQIDISSAQQVSAGIKGTK